MKALQKAREGNAGEGAGAPRVAPRSGKIWAGRTPRPASRVGMGQGHGVGSWREAGSLWGMGTIRELRAGMPADQNCDPQASVAVMGGRRVHSGE